MDRNYFRLFSFVAARFLMLRLQSWLRAPLQKIPHFVQSKTKNTIRRRGCEEFVESVSHIIFVVLHRIVFETGKHTRWARGGM